MAEISIGVSRLLSSGYPQGAGSGQPGVLPKNTLVEEVLTYQKRLERVRHNQDSIWDDTDNYVISRRSHYNVGYIRGTRRMTRVVLRYTMMRPPMLSRSSRTTSKPSQLPRLLTGTWRGFEGR